VTTSILAGGAARAFCDRHHAHAVVQSFRGRSRRGSACGVDAVSACCGARARAAQAGW
jgi:hypothetical protein